MLKTSLPSPRDFHRRNPREHHQTQASTSGSQWQHSTMDTASDCSNAAVLGNDAGKIWKLEQIRTIILVETCSILRSPFPIFQCNMVISANNTLSTLESNSKPSSSCPSMISSLTSLSPTPGSMERDQSTGEARSSEPVTDLPAQKYFLPFQQDDHKLAADVSNQGFPGDEPLSESPAQERLLPNHHKLESDVSNQVSPGDEPPPEPRAQEHMVSEGHNGQNSSVAAAPHKLIDHDDQATISVPPSPTSRPVNVVSEEDHDYQATVSVPVNDQMMAATEATYPEDHYLRTVLDQVSRASGSDTTFGTQSHERNVPPMRMTRMGGGSRVIHPASQAVLHEAPPTNAPGTTVDTRSHEGNVFPQSRTTQMRGDSEGANHRDQFEASQAVLHQTPPRNAPCTTFGTQPQQRTVLPPLQMTAPNDRTSRWISQRSYPYPGYLPSPNEDRRWEEQTPPGHPRRLVHGDTQPLGPPLKPFDGPRTEYIAQEQYRVVRRD